tara:strand:+ start:199 stop:489 length:291 start_codon:yes stop_codon:yes gene_type:complete
MSTERKCDSCGAWNTKTTCETCGNELDPQKIRIKQVSNIQEEKALEPTPKIEKFLENWKQTKNPLYKLFYWMAYSIWFVYMGIISFILFMVAWGPG